ncbi:MAG: PDZ domain-containing protein [Gemmatimonadota bacterium]
MKVQWIVPVIAALAATPLVAQQDPITPRAQVRIQEMPNDRVMGVLLTRHARLGLGVNLEAGASDSVGALVESVTPGGPAAKAGIRSGDVITRIDGKSLTERDNVRVGREQSMPGLRLVEIAARLSPKTTVPIEFRRGKDRRTVRLVTSEDDAGDLAALTSNRVWTMNIDSQTTFFKTPSNTLFPGVMERSYSGALSDAPGAYRYRAFFGSPLSNLELAPLNGDLGSYFGTTEGVLVINVPQESKLGLKGGDVILSVDGRKPTGPAHLMRILQSYDQGEDFKIEVMRNRRRESVTARLGDKPDPRKVDR